MKYSLIVFGVSLIATSV
jgi:hypothetical protein